MLNPSLSLSTNQYDSSGQEVIASVSLYNRPDYHGKPAISGLTTITPKIVCSRVPSGIASFGIMFSASETTCDAGDPYLDLDYRWSFGDGSGVETFTDQYNNETVNANNSQQGPEACYLYRSSGNYTVTLTASGKDHNGNIITATTSTILTIGTYYIWLGNKTGGTFTLTVNGETTSAIAWDADNATILAALHALPSLDSSNCKMQYQKNVVEFIGNLTGTNITFTGDFSGLTGTAGTPSIRTEIPSSSYSQVSVQSSSGLTTQYFDSNYGGENGASDGTQTRPYTTIAQLRTFLIGGSNRKAILVDGSSWTMTANIKWDAGQSKIRIERSGGGAKPIINAGIYSFTIEGSWGYSASPNLLGGDVVFYGIDFRSTSGHNMISGYGSNNNDVNYPYSLYSNFVFDNCSYTSSVTTSDAGFISITPSNNGGSFMTGFLVWKCDLDMGSASQQAMFVGISQWFATIGGVIEGGDGNLTLDHHIYTNLQDHCLLRWIRSDTGSKSYFLNANASNSAGTIRYYLVDGCRTGGVLRAFDFSNSNNDSGLSGKFDKVVLQFNKVDNSLTGLLCYNLYRIVIRFCDFWNNSNGAISSADDVSPTTYYIYNNNFYSSIVAIVENQYAYYRNNLHHATNSQSSSWKVGLQFRGSSGSVELWDCDYNYWYNPDSANAFYNRTTDTYTSFATWQSWGNDVNGFNSSPNFYNPSGGIFVKNPKIKVDWPDSFTNLEVYQSGSWVPYNDNSYVIMSSGINTKETYQFKALTGGQDGQQTINIYSDSDTVSDEQTLSTYITGLIKKFYRYAANGLYFIFKTG